MEPLPSEKPKPQDSPEAVEPGADAIELEPSLAADVPRYVVHDGGATYSRNVMPLPPVPSRPLHLCPCCDYILTGLTTYRCPECGEPFTLSEARGRAIEKSPGMRSHRLVAFVERFGTPIGLLLFLAAAIVPNAVHGGFSTWPVTTVTVVGLASWVVIAPLLVAAAIARAVFESSWSIVLFISGLLAAGVAAVFCLL